MDRASGPYRRPSTSRLDPLPSTHPLSIKIRTIFDASSSFSSDAQATRQALQELEERYGVRKAAKKRTGARTAPSANVASTSAAASQSLPIATPAKAGRIISVDTERARQCVANDAQDSLEQACLSFLDALNGVDATVEEMSLLIGDLRTEYNGLDDRLKHADEATYHLLQHAKGLRKQSALITQQSSLLNIFLERFTLTPAELEAIESRSIPVGVSLFHAMDKLARIRNEAQVLLVGQEEGVKGGMRAGIDVMEETAGLLDQAQQKIAKWLYAEMRSFAREGVDVGQHVREAVLRLDGREDLLGPALNILSSARSQLLSSAFQNALTVGGPAPTYLPRPIELHAHDPKRYVGDMLAWVHQSVASEREFLTALFSKLGDVKGLEGMRRMGQRRRGLEGSVDWTKSESVGLPKAERWTRDTLDRVLEGCCAPLQVRIDQTVKSQEGCITTFRLASLIQFYRVTMERTLGTRARLSQTLKALSVSAYQAFVATLDNQAAGLNRFHEQPESQDLSPPAPIAGSAATLRELLSVHQASLSETDLFGDALPLNDIPSDDLRDFVKVIHRLVEPMVSLSVRLADEFVSQRGRGQSEDEARWKRDIFLINCLDYIKAILEPYHFTARLISRVEEEVEQTIGELIKRHYVQLCNESGLDTACRFLDDNELSNGQLDQPTIEKSLTVFEAFLASPTLISSPHLNRLHTPTTRALVHSRALELVARDYDRIVVQAQSKVDSTAVAVPLRDAVQVRLLLGIESRSAA